MLIFTTRIDIEEDHYDSGLWSSSSETSLLDKHRDSREGPAWYDTFLLLEIILRTCFTDFWNYMRILGYYLRCIIPHGPVDSVVRKLSSSSDLRRFILWRDTGVGQKTKMTSCVVRAAMSFTLNAGPSCHASRDTIRHCSLTTLRYTI